MKAQVIIICFVSMASYSVIPAILAACVTTFDATPRGFCSTVGRC